MGNLSLYVAREPPSTSLATVLAQKRIGPSLADRSRVELALLPRLSLTRLSRTQSLFLFGGSFVLHSLYITRRERREEELVASTLPSSVNGTTGSTIPWSCLVKVSSATMYGFQF